MRPAGVTARGGAVASAPNHAMICMMTRCVALLLLVALPVTAARAQPAPVVVDLTYAGYKSGFHVLTAHSELLIAPTGYRISLNGNTSGMIGFFYHADWQSWADGTWTNDSVRPQHFDNDGVFGGHPRRIDLQYRNGNPVIRTLDPRDDGEHLPVPPDMTQHSIDSLSITALVVRQVAMMGRCDGQVTVFDGRSVENIALRPGGAEYLPATSRSSWAGPTLRCNLYAHMTAGFFRDGSPGERNYVDSIWLASVLPGVPPLPVRTVAHTHHLGELTLYLTDAKLRDAGTLTAKTP